MEATFWCGKIENKHNQIVARRIWLPWHWAQEQYCLWDPSKILTSTPLSIPCASSSCPGVHVLAFFLELRVACPSSEKSPLTNLIIPKSLSGFAHVLFSPLGVRGKEKGNDFTSMQTFWVKALKNKLHTMLRHLIVVSLILVQIITFLNYSLADQDDQKTASHQCWAV